MDLWEMRKKNATDLALWIVFVPKLYSERSRPIDKYQGR